jgi:cytochrome c oxidase cbb3-type subunit III
MDLSRSGTVTSFALAAALGLLPFGSSAAAPAADQPSTSQRNSQAVASNQAPTASNQPSTAQSDSQAVASEQPPGPTGPDTRVVDVGPYSGTVPAGLLLRVPVSGVVPGNLSVAPNITNPFQNDSGSAQRGMQNFDSFNCSGCHAANGAGGMGPSLSNNKWIYRSSPANIFLTIYQGRSAGMPAFGSMLPDTAIWDLVSYIVSITEKPTRTFGKTTSKQQGLPATQQVSANLKQTTTPWQFTEAFSNGRRP